MESRRERKLYTDPSGVPNTVLAPAELTYGNYVSYAMLGLKLGLGRGVTLELGLLENLFDPDVTADLGLVCAASWRF